MGSILKRRMQRSKKCACQPNLGWIHDPFPIDTLLLPSGYTMNFKSARNRAGARGHIYTGYWLVHNNADTADSRKTALLQVSLIPPFLNQTRYTGKTASTSAAFVGQGSPLLPPRLTELCPQNWAHLWCRYRLMLCLHWGFAPAPVPGIDASLQRQAKPLLALVSFSPAWN